MSNLNKWEEKAGKPESVRVPALCRFPDSGKFPLDSLRQMSYDNLWQNDFEKIFMRGKD